MEVESKRTAGRSLKRAFRRAVMKTHSGCVERRIGGIGAWKCCRYKIRPALVGVPKPPSRAYVRACGKTLPILPEVNTFSFVRGPVLSRRASEECDPAHVGTDNRADRRSGTDRCYLRDKHGFTPTIVETRCNCGQGRHTWMSCEGPAVVFIAHRADRDPRRGNIVRRSFHCPRSV